MIQVIPMAGFGERFRRAGWTTPKPLIEVDGEPMFVRATRSLPLRLATKLVFVLRREDNDQYGIDRVIRQCFDGVSVKVVLLDRPTSGQAETVRLGMAGEPVDQPILIFNADSAFEDDTERYFAELDPSVAGVLQVFKDVQERWSFVRCGDDLQVTETAEKRAISNWACTGLYYFRSGREFEAAYEHSAPSVGERYVAPMYNWLIAQGGKILAKPVRRYFCFGTPDDLRAHLEQAKTYTG